MPTVSEIRKISVAGFDGQGGGAFATALEAELYAASFDGQRYFTMVSGQRGQAAADAVRYGRSLGAQGVLLGQTTLGMNNENYQSTTSQCVQREGDKCKRWEQVKVACTRRTADLTVVVRMVQISNGQIVYSDTKSASAGDSWCQGQTRDSTDEALVASAITRITADVRRDIAPYNDVLKATLKETAAGLPKPQAEQFAMAVKAAKAQNMIEACRLWTEIDQAAPQHSWTIYNRGVCAESGGDYAGALERYRQTQLFIGGGDRIVNEAVARVRALMEAEGQLSAEAARRDRAAKARAAEDAQRAAEEAEAALTRPKPPKKPRPPVKGTGAAPDARKAQLIAKYGAAIGAAIYNRQVLLGMTYEQVRASRGAPSSLKKQSATSEVWIYGAMTVTFTNGRVTAVR